MNAVQRLRQMGCGQGIIDSVIERSRINAAVSNSNMWLKYYKGAYKSGIYPTDYTIQKLTECLNELKATEYLVNIYHELWQEKFSKSKLSIEKFISELQNQLQ
jgi:hypothetical protein